MIGVGVALSSWGSSCSSSPRVGIVLGVSGSSLVYSPASAAAAPGEEPAADPSVRLAAMRFRRAPASERPHRRRRRAPCAPLPPAGQLRRERRTAPAPRGAAPRPRRPDARDVPPRPVPAGPARRPLRRARSSSRSGSPSSTPCSPPRSRAAARAPRPAASAARPIFWGSKFCAQCGRPVARRRRAAVETP